MTTLSASFDQDINAFARAGWPAVELWLTKLELAVESLGLAQAIEIVRQSGLSAPVAATQGGLIGGSGEAKFTHLEHYRRRLDLLGQMDVRTLVIVPDFASRPAREHLRSVVDDLGEAARIAREFGVRLALEFQKSALFCASLDTAVALVESVGESNLGVCLDLFHYYTGPSKFEDLGLLTLRNLAHIQISDLSGTPRELAVDSDRILPGDGDFQISPVLELLSSIAYEGAVSVEVPNPSLWAIPVDRVADVALLALNRTLQAARAPADGGA